MQVEENRSKWEITELELTGDLNENLCIRKTVNNKGNLTKWKILEFKWDRKMKWKGFILKILETEYNSSRWEVIEFKLTGTKVNSMRQLNEKEKRKS